MTRENRQIVLDTIIDQNAGRLPVAAGVIDMTTPRCLEHVADARERGVDALVATAPFYVRTHANEIEEHFRQLHAAAPDLKLFAYNLPVSVNVVLEIPMLIRLAQEGVLAGIKDSGGKDDYTRAVVAARKTAQLENFVVLTGSEMTVDYAYLGGCDGVVPGLGNVDPYAYVQLHETCRAKNWEQAVEIQERINKLMAVAFVGDGSRMGGSAAGLGGFKSALHHLGIFASPAWHLRTCRLTTTNMRGSQPSLMNSATVCNGAGAKQHPDTERTECAERTEHSVLRYRWYENRLRHRPRQQPN